MNKLACPFCSSTEVGFIALDNIETMSPPVEMKDVDEDKFLSDLPLGKFGLVCPRCECFCMGIKYSQDSMRIHWFGPAVAKEGKQQKGKKREEVPS